MGTAEVATNAERIALERLPELDAVGAAFGLPAGVVHVNGLQLTDPDTTFEEWSQFGHRIGAFGRWHRFALGDWILFGEALFGEDASQGLEATASDRYDVGMRVTGLALDTLKNYVRICQLVPLPVRRVELDFSIHEAVAALEREDQIYWLDQAVVNSYTREELRQAIRDSKAPPADDAEPSGPEVVPDDPPLSAFDQLREAASRVFHQAQPTSEGGVMVPPEPWAAFCAALGEE